MALEGIRAYGMVPLHEGDQLQLSSAARTAAQPAYVAPPAAQPAVYQDQSSVWAAASNGTYNPVGGPMPALPGAQSLWDRLRATLAMTLTPVRQTPYISQYSPAGREFGYTNGNANCGPASMAMVARAIGYGSNLNDAQLINYLGGVGRTGASGTSVNGIAAMAQTMGLAAEIRGSGPDTAWIAQQLTAGRYVVANGDYFAMAPHANPNRTSGHYVLITGRDAYGRFLVQDPADPDARAVDEQELAHYIRSNTNGGFQVAVG
ncbi:MAG: C39 family peptidase [Candidatus Sericytochromatia bacterium]|uniref:C39 family peptidase n=1 Tax=Candidatus Tanganyikabacteria bacterium TaxID=2961651 RepID=A0A937X2U2_9BACT|nr:C39 family peptidase [Candidatus Tanganyikabacteria bacterium]